MIALAGVSKSFGAHQVLRGVDLAVERSEVVLSLIHISEPTRPY